MLISYAQLHGRTVPGVPRWVKIAAYAVTLITLPASVWRIAAMFGAPVNTTVHGLIAGHGPIVVSGPGYIIGLSLVSEALAFLTIGLVSDWGEVFPRWIPLIGTRRVPVLAAVLPGAFGAIALTAISQLFLIMALNGRKINGAPGLGLNLHGWQQYAFVGAYGPLLLWGPLLSVVTLSYYRRRR